MDYAHEQTDKALEELERRIRAVYSEASQELQAKIEAYFEHFKLRDEQQRALMEAGEITREQYQLWRLAQIGRGERLQALQAEIARRNNEANQAAASYINDATPGIYSLNHNYTAYTIEQVHGNVGFTILDEQTVRRLLAENPELFPAPKVNVPFDLQWNKAELRRQLVSGIIQGESIGKLADRFRKVTDMNRASALRNARTAVTGAQNAGRQESMLRAKEMGIKQRKRWIAARDLRTRHSHGVLDGQTVEVDECFVSVLGSRLMYPCDSSRGADPSDIYNCRCTMRTVEKEEVEAEPRMMRVRNPVTGRNEVVSEMTYSEWLQWKDNVTAATIAENDADAIEFFSVDSRDDLKSIVHRSTMRTQGGFACFPDGDPLNENIKAVKPLKTYFDVAMHGSPTAVGFGSTSTNMSARTLAALIRHSEGYDGKKIRLLSCSTGKIVGEQYCFAEELANALGVEVKAPNDTLYITKRGALSVGEFGDGKFVSFKPNQRRRIK